jgi:hypothetical protein
VGVVGPPAAGGREPGAPNAGPLSVRGRSRDPRAVSSDERLIFSSLLEGRMAAQHFTRRSAGRAFAPADARLLRRYLSCLPFAKDRGRK